MSATITIVYDGTNVLVNGPIQDKILCLGMIELAKRIVLNDANIQKAPMKTLVPPPPNGQQFS